MRGKKSVEVEIVSNFFLLITRSQDTFKWFGTYLNEYKKASKFKFKLLKLILNTVYRPGNVKSSASSSAEDNKI